MVDQCLLAKLYDCSNIPVHTLHNRLICQDIIEEYFVPNGGYEKWKIQIAMDVKTGTSYWCYLEKID